MDVSGFGQGEAFVILRASDVPEALTDGIVPVDGHRVVFGDASLAAAFGERIIGTDHAVLRVDMTALSDRIDPDAPGGSLAYVEIPPASGHYTYLRGPIPPEALAEIEAARTPGHP